MASQHWTAQDIPDQRGKVALVTGANSGIGYEAARALAGKGAQVIMACRSMDKAQAAAQKIRDEYPHAQLDLRWLDLADLASVRDFAAAVRDEYSQLHLLINNAGVMALPRRLATADGFEMQFGTNHLGHFALTGLILDRVTAAPGARIVHVSSVVHGAPLIGNIHFDDLHAEKSYSKWHYYGQSKLANLLFAYELHRRLQAAGHDTRSVGVHPGWTATNLQTHSLFFRVLNPLMGQSIEMGALPTLYAATAPDVNGCDYIGPGGLTGLRGYPRKVRASKRAYDPALARRLWEVSEALTGVTYQTV